MMGFFKRFIERIHWRVIGSTVFFLFLALSLATWINIRDTREDYLEETKTRIDLIGTAIRKGDLLKDSGDLLNYTKEIHPEITDLTLFDEEGRVILTTLKHKNPVIRKELLERARRIKETTAGRWNGRYEIISPFEMGGKRLFLKAEIPIPMVEKELEERMGVSAFILFLSLLIYIPAAHYFLRKDLSHPVEMLLRHINHVAKGDISHDCGIRGKAEIRALTIALNQAVRDVREMIGEIKEVTDRLLRESEKVDEVRRSIDSGIFKQAEAIGQTGASIEEFQRNIEGISKSLSTLSTLTEDTSSAVLEIASSIEEVDGNVEDLTISIEQTSSSIEEIARSLKEVARAIEDLSASADETVASLSQIDASIKDIEENATDNARLSQEVAQKGEKGLEAVKKTHEGMERIKESVASISSIINELGRNSREIGKILNVIDEVAEETNLLALNAAILAAQAGEYGKGFSVVAEEIRELAERTSSSTKEIGTIIKGVQLHTEKAIASVREGMEKVEEGERLSKETIAILSSILEYFRKSNEMGQMIAKATQEQARGSREVTQNLHRITDTIHQIATATQEQSKGSEQIAYAVERMKELASQIKKATKEQTASSRSIASNTERIAASTERIKESLLIQEESLQDIVMAMSKGQETMKQNQGGVEMLSIAVEGLKGGIQDLIARVERFKLERERRDKEE